MNKIQNSIILLLISSLSVFSQENDFQSWSSFSATIDFNVILVPDQLFAKTKRKGSITFKQGYRFRENSSLLSKQYSDFRFKLMLNKRLSFALGYRYAANWDTPLESSTLLFYPYVYNRHRYYSDIIIKRKVKKRFLVYLRSRYLYQGNTFEYTSVIREKVGVSYNIRKTKLKPESSVECFYTWNESIDKLRYTFLISYPFNKNLDFDLAYRIQQEFYVNNPETLFIFGGKLSYKL
jgi:hypothetical protein